jgi:hypothetical protein
MQEIQNQLDKGKVFYYFTDEQKDPADIPDPVDPEPTDKATTVSYTPDASFLITIPASVVLEKDRSVTRSIKAEHVKLNNDKKLVVTLDDAEHNGEKDAASGKRFSALTADGSSTAYYSIKDSQNQSIGIGDTVATFVKKEEDEVQTADLEFSKPMGVTFAGEHTETLTFRIGVIDTNKEIDVSWVNADGTPNTEKLPFPVNYKEDDTWTNVVEQLKSEEENGFITACTTGDIDTYSAGLYALPGKTSIYYYYGSEDMSLAELYIKGDDDQLTAVKLTDSISADANYVWKKVSDSDSIWNTANS